MADMLTAKEMQDLLQVDRSTIYRMAESKRLPAVKVGRQWRFPAEQVQDWLKQQSIPATTQVQPTPQVGDETLASLLPLDCVQLIQDSFAEALGAMIVVTDMQGNPVTQISHPCGLFNVVREIPDAVQKCVEGWAYLGEILNLEPQFESGHLGLLGARGLIRVGTTLKGMVIIGGIAPDNWPPSEEAIAEMAASFGLSPEVLGPYLDDVFYLDESQKALALSLVQRIANIVSHIANERHLLTGKLNSIAKLVSS